MPSREADAAPLVSVVVATNRAGPFLAEAIQSVREQTYPNLELIVVDDGSPDPAAVAELVTAYEGARLIRQVPSGVSVARNEGVAAAAGRYLVFLDDDDRWAPERLAHQVAALQANPHAVACYCGMQTIDERGRVIASADQIAVRDRFDIARRVTGIILPNLMLCSDVFTRVGGFHSGIDLAEDLDLVLRVSAQGDVVFVPKTLTDYRAHADNTTRRHRRLARGIDQVVRFHLASATLRGDDELVDAHRDSLRANRRFAWWSALRSARRAARSGRFGQAASEVFWAVRFAPTAPADAVFRRLRGS